MYVGTATATSADKPTSNCPSRPLGEYIEPNFEKRNLQISFYVGAPGIVENLLHIFKVQILSVHAT